MEGPACQVRFSMMDYPSPLNGHDKRAPPYFGRTVYRRDLLVRSVCWSAGGKSFTTRNKHSQRSPVGAIHELPLPMLMTSTYPGLGGTCLSGSHLGKVERDNLSPLIRRPGRKAEKNCPAQGKIIPFSTHPAGNGLHCPFLSPITEARWKQRKGLRWQWCSGPAKQPAEGIAIAGCLDQFR